MNWKSNVRKLSMLDKVKVFDRNFKDSQEIGI